MTTCPMDVEACDSGCPTMLDCKRAPGLTAMKYGPSVKVSEEMADAGIMWALPFTGDPDDPDELVAPEAPMARILRSFKAAGKTVTCHTIDGGNPTGEISGVEDGLVSLVNGQAVYHIDISLITTVESVRDEG